MSRHDASAGRGRGARGAFTLIETVVVVVVLALAVPPVVSMLEQSVNARTDAVQATRATVLACAVLENILADAASSAPGLGFAALADTSAYLAHPTNGLYARATPVTTGYAAAGISYAVAIGPLVSANGSATGDLARDVFRLVTVTATYGTSQGGAISLPVSALVTGP